MIMANKIWFEKFFSQNATNHHAIALVIVTKNVNNKPMF